MIPPINVQTAENRLIFLTEDITVDIAVEYFATIALQITNSFQLNLAYVNLKERAVIVLQN